MRWAVVGQASVKPALDSANEKRASRVFSGNGAGLYKRAAGRSLALCSLREEFCLGSLRPPWRTMAEGDNRSTNLLVRPGGLAPRDRTGPACGRAWAHRGRLPRPRLCAPPPRAGSLSAGGLEEAGFWLGCADTLRHLVRVRGGARRARDSSQRVGVRGGSAGGRGLPLAFRALAPTGSGSPPSPLWS